MTVIAAARTADGVVMAADSQATGHRKYLDISKLWTGENLVFGASGSLRAAQVARHHVTWPKYRPDEMDFEKYLIGTVWPAVRAGVKDHGVLTVDSGVETLPLTMLMAAGDQVAEVACNGAVIVERSGRAAIGSGYAEALGALGDTGPWTEADVIDAVRRAAVTACGVGGAITVVNANTREIRTVNA